VTSDDDDDDDDDVKVSKLSVTSSNDRDVVMTSCPVTVTLTVGSVTDTSLASVNTIWLAMPVLTMLPCNAACVLSKFCPPGR